MPIVEGKGIGLDNLVKHLEEIDKYTVKAGWGPQAVYEDGTPVAYVASLQEFGVPERSIPARPFARPTVANNRAKWDETAKLGAKSILEGKQTIDQVIGKLGQMIEGDLVKSIAAVNSPELSKITIMARKWKRMGKKITGKTIGEIARLIAEGKGDFSGVSTKPLNDTGHMIATVSHVVEKSG